MIWGLLKKEIKSNTKLFLIILLIVAIYVFSLLAMYNPDLEESLVTLEKSMPEVLALFGMQDRGTTLLDFIVNYLYRFVLIVTPFVYSSIMCYKLIAKYIENGSMAYLLNSFYSRKQIMFTQGIGLILSIFLIIVFTTVLTIVSCYVMHPGELDIPGFLLLNLGLLMLQLFLAMFCFMFTGMFVDTKYSIGIGTGIVSFFITIQMLSQVFDNGWLKYMNPINLFNPDRIIQFDGISIISIGILFLFSILFFFIAIKAFENQDLSL